MLFSTTFNIDGRETGRHLGLVTGEAIMAANVFRDLFAVLRDIWGGRSKSYEEVLEKCRDRAIQVLIDRARGLGADAVIGVQMDITTMKGGGLMAVTVIGTAVKLS